MSEENVYDCIFVCDMVSEEEALVPSRDTRGWVNWFTPFQWEMDDDPTWWQRFGRRDDTFDDIPF